MHDLHPREVAALAPALVLIVGLGFFPQPVLNVINPAVDEIVGHVGGGDPAPKSPTDLAEKAAPEGAHE
jgi:NADH-quinone oxidoreductase subunit M